MNHLAGQIRASGPVVLGYDMSAALATARALGISPAAVAEILPVIEAHMVRASNRKS